MRPLRGVANPLSFDEFFAAESEALYRRMRLVTRDHHEAEEVVRDAFLSLHERRDRIAGIPDPVGYLYRTAFNAWKRSRRAAQAIRNVFAPQPERDEFEAADARTIVGEAPGHLTPRQRGSDRVDGSRRTLLRGGSRGPRRPAGHRSGACVAGASLAPRTIGRCRWLICTTGSSGKASGTRSPPARASACSSVVDVGRGTGGWRRSALARSCSSRSLRSSGRACPARSASRGRRSRTK